MGTYRTDPEKDANAIYYCEDRLEEETEKIKEAEKKATEEGKPLDLEFYIDLYAETRNEKQWYMRGREFDENDPDIFRLTQRLNIIANEIAYIATDKYYRLNKDDILQKR